MDHSIDGRLVANFVLAYCEERGWPITNMALQKIVYFCHVWTLVDRDVPLIRHDFEAWEHGPVLPYLYNEFKVFRDKTISIKASKLDPKTGERVFAGTIEDKELREFLRGIVDFYAPIGALELRNISHVENGPWERVWNHRGEVNFGMKISNESIREFYAKHPSFYSLH